MSAANLPQTVLTFFLLLVDLAVAGSTQAFRPGQAWYDTKGELIHAHGGGLYFEDGVYYFFGEDKRTGDTPATATASGAGYTHAIVCYSSRDLFDWKNEGNIAPEVGLQGALFSKYPLAERPKVIRNDKTGKYVMWAHMENAAYSVGAAGIAIADKVRGPYKFVKFTRVNNDNNHD